MKDGSNGSNANNGRSATLVWHVTQRKLPTLLLGSKCINTASTCSFCLRDVPQELDQKDGFSREKSEIWGIIDLIGCMDFLWVLNLYGNTPQFLPLEYMVHNADP